MAWDPDRYLKFRRERAAPFVDTLSLLEVRTGLSVIDLGCGTGELTAKLHQALPDSNVLGIDNSAEMLARARSDEHLHYLPRTIEEQCERDERFDLVFSHAAIHWVDDHARLVPRLLKCVAPGGQLLVQLPSNHDHEAMRLVTEAAGWRRKVPVLPLADYAELLHAAGGTDLTVIEKVYPHQLPDAAALFEWLSGTALLPYMERLTPPGRVALAGEILARFTARWPGEVFFGFKRIIFSARR